LEKKKETQDGHSQAQKAPEKEQTQEKVRTDNYLPQRDKHLSKMELIPHLNLKVLK